MSEIESNTADNERDWEALSREFLSQYWSSSAPLTKLNSTQHIAAHFKRGIRVVTSLPTSSSISILTIATSLFLLAGFFLIIQNIDGLLSETGNKYYLTAYLKEGYTREQIDTYAASLRRDKRQVRSVEVVLKDRALKLFATSLGRENAFLLEGIEDNNPLPNSIDIVLRSDEVGVDGVIKIAKRLRAHDMVDDVVYGSEWIESIQGLMSVFRLLGSTTLMISLIVIVFLIANTIKLVIYSPKG